MNRHSPVLARRVGRRLVWRLAATFALLVVLGSAAGAGIGYLLAQGIELVLSGIV